MNRSNSSAHKAARSIQRVASIDVFRALTMFLMIFVNDVDGVRQIPDWIKHVGADESGLGFADVIFPAFLFIVGLSIPLAIQRKLKQGYGTSYLVQYISVRAIALIIMGLFHVNFSYYNESLALLPKPIYIIFTTLAFFLIWLDYSKISSKKNQIILQVLGIGSLIALAAVYRSGTPEQPEWMKLHWWGILGLIGWAYWLVALAYLFLREKLGWLIGFFVMLALCNIAVHMQLISLPTLIVGDAAHAILVAGGVICTQLYNFFREKPTLLLLIGLVLIGFGMILSGFTDGINKIRATPAWVHICMGISFAFYAASVYLIDLKRKEHYFSWISAAGTNTLTCYLLPYCWYAVFQLLGLHWPTLFNIGAGGIFRSFLIAFIIVLVAGWMGKRGVRIKV